MPLQFIHITAAYSNAVLTAILPHLSDCSQKLELPIPLPITISQVQKSFPCYIKGYVMGSVTLTNGYWFSYDRGYVSGFRCPNNPFEAEAYGNWQAFVGVDNMTTNEAIQMARDSFRKLGYQPEKFHLDAPPTRMEGPNTYEVQGVPNSLHHEPYCRVFWDSPESAIQDMLGHRYNISFAIDLQRKQVVGMSLSGRDFVQPMPKVDIEPELESDYQKRVRSEGAKNYIPNGNYQLAPGGNLPPVQTPITANPLGARLEDGVKKTPPLVVVTPTYSNAMLVASLPLISDFARKLELPMRQPLSPDGVISSHPSNIKDVFGNIVIFTNGFYFMIANGYVRGFGSPDDWFEEQKTRTDWPLYVSKDCLATNDAIELARVSFRKLGYQPEVFRLESPPTTFENAYAHEYGKKEPQYAYCRIGWEGTVGPEGRGDEYHIEFDINLQSKQVVGASLASKNFSRPDPKIDLP